MCNLVFVRCLQTSVAGAEYGSRVSQINRNRRDERVRAAQHAPRDPFRVLERIHGLAEIAERGVGVPVEHPRVSLSHSERGFIVFADNTLRHGYHFQEQ